MKFRTPNPKLEDELAMEYVKRMKENGDMDFWEIEYPSFIRHIESDGKVTDKNNLTLRK